MIVSPGILKNSPSLYPEGMTETGQCVLRSRTGCKAATVDELYVVQNGSATNQRADKKRSAYSNDGKIIPRLRSYGNLHIKRQTYRAPPMI